MGEDSPAFLAERKSLALAFFREGEEAINSSAMAFKAAFLTEVERLANE
jgi:hypothetical protein